jgi:exodeoxyribonuclease VII large subunit
MAADRPIFDPDRVAAPATPSLFPQIVTVSHLNALIKRVLTDQLPGTIHLVGEISNCCRHSSGHLYLTLKDDRSEIRAVMWRSAAAALKFAPADGMEVIATGSVDVYENRGQYQFLMRKLEPRGAGALDLAFRQLRDRLATQGLFEQERKKPIPRFPRRIALVTSPSGAALRDILKTLKRRFPSVTVLLHPVRVQGDGAADDIAAALRRLNAQAIHLGGIDTLILARGGGSLEDLWSFNEEVVARAIFESQIPIISGVGHEVDITIADLVADLRAPTPTAAAELAVPVLDEVVSLLAAQSARLSRSLGHRLDRARARLEAVERFEWFRDPARVLGRREQRVDELTSRLRLCCIQRLSAAHRRLHELELMTATVQPMVLVRRFGDRLDGLATRISPSLQRFLQSTRQKMDDWQARLEAISYRRTLARGFTITRSHRDGKLLTHPKMVTPGERIVTETADGSFESQALDREQGKLFE